MISVHYTTFSIAFGAVHAYKMKQRYVQHKSR